MSERSRRLRPLTEEEFHSKPDIADHFGSYENYVTRLVEPWQELTAYMELWDELDQVYKIEPVTPNPARVVKGVPG